MFSQLAPQFLLHARLFWNGSAGAASADRRVPLCTGKDNFVKGGVFESIELEVAPVVPLFRIKTAIIVMHPSATDNFVFMILYPLFPVVLQSFNIFY